MWGKRNKGTPSPGMGGNLQSHDAAAADSVEACGNIVQIVVCDAAALQLPFYGQMTRSWKIRGNRGNFANGI